MARWIDDIVEKIKQHPHMSKVHKQILINRINKPPTREEIIQASKEVEGGFHDPAPNSVS